MLHFSKPDGRRHKVGADILAKEIRDSNVPIVILNACNSATELDGPSNLAKIFISQGIGLVVAMSFKIMAKAAAQFTTEFYSSLISGAGIDEALWAGKAALFERKERQGRFGLSVTVEDWVVPVLYKNGSLPLSSFSFYSGMTKPAKSKVPIDAISWFDLYGRDAEILDIERLLLRDPSEPFMLLKGMSGIGKSHLLRQLCQWWKVTGLIKRSVFIDFKDEMKNVDEICKAIISDLSDNNTSLSSGQDINCEVVHLCDLLMTDKSENVVRGNENSTHIG